MRPLGASLYTVVVLFFNSETASVQHTPDLCIACQQERRAQNLVTAQLIEINDGTELEDVLNHVFQQGFVDSNWRLKRRRTARDPLVRGPGNTPESALTRVISDIPVAIYVHYEYLHDRDSQTYVQRIGLDMPSTKFMRLAHLTNYIFAEGYLPSKVRSAVSWRCASGKHIEKNTRLDYVLSLGGGVSEDKPLCLVIDLKLVE